MLGTRKSRLLMVAAVGASLTAAVISIFVRIIVGPAPVVPGRQEAPPRGAQGPAIQLEKVTLPHPLVRNRQGREPKGDTTGTVQRPDVPALITSHPILSAIVQVESSHDAKCHSTACRFENFLFGTPLTIEAREERIDLQKQLVERLWRVASEDAAGAGEESVTPRHLRPQIERVYRRTTAENGDWVVTFGDGGPLTIPEARVRQFASITYSLRAILAVKQEQLLSGAGSLRALDPAGIEVLREVIDTVTLSALMIADERARQQNVFELDRRTLRAAWRSLVPAADDGPGSDNDPDEDGAGVESRQAAQRILFEIARRKRAAYNSYNELTNSEKPLREIFRYRAGAFYARFTLPGDQAVMANLRKVLDDAIDGFAAEVLRESDTVAERSGHVLVRFADATVAVHQLMPHEIDDFEDVHFFGRLDRTEHVVLEAYDCDSFRDFGSHWSSLSRAVAREGDRIRPPDPFAAEVIAEAVSQYGVLVLRVAGRVAREQRKSAVLRAEHVEEARRRIPELARRHHAAPERQKQTTRITSAEGTIPDRGDETFFTDVTSEAGVGFVHRSSRWLNKFRRHPFAVSDTKMLKGGLPTFNGAGVAAEDIDGDGDTDLLFVGAGGNALLVNDDGQGHFRDVSEAAGIRWKRPDGGFGEARQPLIVDFDNDGNRDILVTYTNDDHRLYRNLGGLRFEDVTDPAGLGGRGLIGGPATAFDFDNDGLLDIYIGFFGDYLVGERPKIARDSRNALPNKLFRNLGGMRFRDVTEGSGTADTGWTQAVSHTDIDRDGLQDIVIGNDFGYNDVLRNLGDGRFESVGRDLGLDKAYHTMNVGINDLNQDGFPDLYFANIATLVKDNKYIMPDHTVDLAFSYDVFGTMLIKESNMLYLSQASEGRLRRYVDANHMVERGSSSTGWAWDGEYLDWDNDGDEDLYVVNGWNDYELAVTSIDVKEKDPKPGNDRSFVHRITHGRESNVFFVNEGGKLKNRSARSGADFASNSRSTTYLDMDRDGDLDIAVNNFQSPATILRNNAQQRGNHWLIVDLIGDPARRVNRDAIGARIVATTATGLRISREIHGGSGYLSMNPKRQHLGLGKAESVDLHITWPNGESQLIKGLAANRVYTMRQGRDTAESNARPAH